MRACSVRALGMMAMVVSLLAWPRVASSCSICRCGDPAFNALGLNIYEPNSFRIAVDWSRFDKAQGLAEGGVTGTESVVENRFTATLSYSPSETLTLIAQLPYATRRLIVEAEEASAEAMFTLHEEGPERSNSHGLADPEVYALIRLWASPFGSGLGRRAWVGLQLGVKTSWGENDLTRDGERLDEHLQPGTGSTDWVVGTAAVYVVDPASSLFGSVEYRRTGSNDHGYRYGRAFLGNFGFERRLGGFVDSVLEVNYRHAGKDRVDSGGELDPNTGGSVVYVTPRVVLTLSDRLVARLSAQVPVATRLNGVQTERTVWAAGLTYVFAS